MEFRNLFVAGLALASACVLAQPTPGSQNRVVTVDRVVAVVNDEAITQYDLDDAKRVVLQQLKQQNVQPPAQDVLDKQVLERMMTERSLLQFAKFEIGQYSWPQLNAIAHGQRITMRSALFWTREDMQTTEDHFRAASAIPLRKFVRTFSKGEMN